MGATGLPGQSRGPKCGPSAVDLALILPPHKAWGRRGNRAPPSPGTPSHEPWAMWPASVPVQPGQRGALMSPAGTALAWRLSCWTLGEELGEGVEPYHGHLGSAGSLALLREGARATLLHHWSPAPLSFRAILPKRAFGALLSFVVGCALFLCYFGVPHVHFSFHGRQPRTSPCSRGEGADLFPVGPLALLLTIATCHGQRVKPSPPGGGENPALGSKSE